MRPAPLRRVLLIQAIEKSDGDGELLSSDLRADATREAARPLSRDSSVAEQDRFFAQRAAHLTDHLVSHRPALAPLIPVPHRFRYFAIALLLGAAILGWSTQALGQEKLVNILSFPLLGILAWNLIVYLTELIRAAGSLKKRDQQTDDAEAGGLLTRAAESLEKLPAAFRKRDRHPDVPASLRQALTDFQRRWRRLVEPITVQRIRAALHLAAALLAGAAVAGMYAEGAANEYRAYWESTFFTPGALQALLGTLFGPASLLSGIEVPDVAPLHRTATTPEVVGENAARWIHLYALTIGLFVVLPRLVLGTWHTIVARRREIAIDPRQLTGTGLYFDRILAEALGTALRTGAVAYCHQLSPTAEGSLQRNLERDLGVPVTLAWKSTLKLGDEEDAPRELITEAAETLPAHFVLCFDFSVTPEQETHGELIREMRKALNEQETETHFHVCLDAEGFDETRRNLPDFAKRREDRFEAWRSVAGPARENVAVFPPIES